MSAVSITRLSAGVMIPDLLRAEPRARAVLDKYGLRGCGGLLRRQRIELSHAGRARAEKRRCACGFYADAGVHPGARGRPLHVAHLARRTAAGAGRRV